MELAIVDVLAGVLLLTVLAGALARKKFFIDPSLDLWPPFPQAFFRRFLTPDQVRVLLVASSSAGLAIMLLARLLTS